MPIREPTFRPATNHPGRAVVEGEAPPHTTVEVENTTVKVERGASTVTTFTTDANGRYAGAIPLTEGDFVRLRTTGPQGPSSWLTVRARGLTASDGTNARLDAFAIAVAARPDGTVAIDGRGGAPLSEPHATVRISSPSRGRFIDVTLDADGRIPNPPLVLDAAPGDELHVAVSDGTHNVGFGMTALVLTVKDGPRARELDDPAPLARDGALSTVKTSGPLFVDGPRATDVQQGSIGNCYVPAAFAALAHHCPDALASMIRENDDGTFTVRFFDTSWTPVPRQVLVDVDGDLYAKGGRLAYGRTLDGGDAATAERWFPILEKAYAAFRGSYEIVGQGGAGGKVMSNVLGAYDDYTDVPSSPPDVVWQKLASAMTAGSPTTAGTHGTAEQHRFTNSGLYANHAYSVLGVREDGGRRFVTLRNPWGSSEAGNDGKNDGIFELDFERFVKLFVNVASVPVP